MTEPTPAKVLDFPDPKKPKTKAKPPEGPPPQQRPALAICFAQLDEKDITARCLSDVFRVIFHDDKLLWLCTACGKEHSGGEGRWVVL